MKKFSVKKCRILWDKRKKILKKAKPAIKKDLLSMSAIIQEAMEYTKDKTLKKRETVIIYWLNTNMGEDWYTITIHYEPGYKAWNITMRDHEEPIGEIVSDTWPLFQILLDEDVELETI